MIVFFANYLTCTIEIWKPSKTLRQLLIPSLFFSLICILSIGYTQKELVVLLGLTAFIFKFLFGGFRLAAQVWTQDKDKVFYFFSLLETVLLWLVLNPLLT